MTNDQTPITNWELEFGRWLFFYVSIRHLQISHQVTFFQ